VEPGTSAATHRLVRETYGQAFSEVVKGNKDSCCASKHTVLAGVDPITRDLYSTEEALLVPQDAIAASFGCGNPTAFAELKPGQRVLDLGSGAGIDVLLSARRVGPQGKAYGLDMTPEMLAMARDNQRAAGIDHAEFLEGTIGNIPLPDGAVDVAISNCVINLSPEKDQVLREAFRVLSPRGQFAVSDIVVTRALPDTARKSIEFWAGCIAGALLVSEYTEELAAAGFVDVSINSARVYSREDMKDIVDCTAHGDEADVQLQAIDGTVMSAFARARKPAS
jgi:SAM-dependent methyltransferase